MRREFVEELTLLAGEDERILLLTADLGFMALEPFIEAHPERFVNVGIAEQNMMGMATGLAEAGFIPFVYSIATFAALRPFEFIRNGPVQHRLPVRVVGIGGGFEYGHNGLSHYGLEDVSVLRTQPGLGILVPADARQSRSAARVAAAHDGPLYLRIGKATSHLPELQAEIVPGRADVVGAGGDVVLVVMGPTAANALEAHRRLEADGVSATTVVVSSFNPGPDEQVVEAVAGAQVAISVEVQYRNGGLGSYVAELAAERGLGVPLVRAAVDEVPHGAVAPQAALEQRHGLDADSLHRLALRSLQHVARDATQAMTP